MTLQQLSDILKGFYALQGEAKGITRDDLAKFLVEKGIVRIDQVSFDTWIRENVYHWDYNKNCYIAAWDNYSEHTTEQLYHLYIKENQTP